MGKDSKGFYEFGQFRMDPARKILLRDGEPVPLTSKAFEMLQILIERGEKVVSKDELMQALWPDSFVEESNLTQHISVLRKALGETPQDHRYILTFPGRGYRFAESVQFVSGHALDPDEEITSVPPDGVAGQSAPSPFRPGPSKGLAWAGLALIALAVSVVAGWWL